MCGLSPSMSLMSLCQLSSDLLVVTSILYGDGACIPDPSHMSMGIPVVPVR